MICPPLKFRGEGVLLGILGGGVPPGSPNPDPISDQKCNFPHPFSDETSKIHSCFQTWGRFLESPDN